MITGHPDFKLMKAVGNNLFYRQICHAIALAIINQYFSFTLISPTKNSGKPGDDALCAYNITRLQFHGSEGKAFQNPEA